MLEKKFKETKTKAFIKKTFKMLIRSKDASVVCWSPDGLSFVIQDQHQFTNNLLPQYFKHNNFASFNRQLNMYGFHKTREDALEFSHPLFQKHNEQLLSKIKRKSAKPLVSRENTTEIAQRLKKFQSQQDNMEVTLDSLEKQYDLIVQNNHSLILELVQSKQREKNIKSFLKSIEYKGKSKPQDIELENFSDEFLSLSPLNEND